MIEVEIDSIRMSLMAQHRVILLKEMDADRYLPIWIGAFEAEAITLELQQVPAPRPYTHDLLKSTIYELGGKLSYILVNELRDDSVFYARLVIEVDSRKIEVDSRPSDAIALAVRANAPIFVAESVMERAAVQPEEDVENEIMSDDEPVLPKPSRSASKPKEEDVDESKLSAFTDFLDTLDLDDLEDED